MSTETDLDALSILGHQYVRLLNNPGDLDGCENAIITVRRHQQITTHFGPLTTKKRIKVSLSQEQILNQTNRFRPKIPRSQSINIQKLVSPNEIIKSELILSRRNSIRPSLIPVKIKDSKLRALTMSPNKDQNAKECQRFKSTRKLSGPFEKRNYVSQQEASLSSLPHLFFKTNRSAFAELLDKFKCGICLNVLNDPRVLDCLHTFCLRCLFKIDNLKLAKTTINKLNPKLRSNSCEGKKSDMSSSNCSDESKESDKKMSKSITSSIAKPISKTYVSTQKNRPDEQNVSQCIFSSLIIFISYVTLKVLLILILKCCTEIVGFTSQAAVKLNHRKKQSISKMSNLRSSDGDLNWWSNASTKKLSS